MEFSPAISHAISNFNNSHRNYPLAISANPQLSIDRPVKYEHYHLIHLFTNEINQIFIISTFRIE